MVLHGERKCTNAKRWPASFGVSLVRGAPWASPLAARIMEHDHDG